jgi:hypothetical protein
MNTTSSVTGTPVSTSTSETSSTSKKLQVRRKQRPLTAQQLTGFASLEMPDGTVLPGREQEWMISAGAQVIDLVQKLDEKYEIVAEGMVLSREVCVQIEKTTGIGTSHSVDKLVAAIERLARISIGSVKVEFTPGQLEELKHRATKRGSTLKQELQRAVDRVKDEIFYGR